MSSDCEKLEWKDLIYFRFLFFTVDLDRDFRKDYHRSAKNRQKTESAQAIKFT